MSKDVCEFCGRPLTDLAVTKTLRGKEHTYCSEFCFRLFFYHTKGMKYEDVKNMYAKRAVDITPMDFTPYLTKRES